jgi:hypothetical protein
MSTVTIELTESDIETLIEALGVWMELPAECEGEEWLHRQDVGADLDLDLREAWARKDDGWGDPDDPDLLMDPVDFAAKHDAEADFIQAGIDAREQIKETSRAATRREERNARMMEGTATPCSDEFMNDPVDW